MINIPLLKEICEVSGAPGFEQAIREVVLREVKSLADEVSVDAMGNVFALKKGTKDKRVMVAAHMDEIGFIVTHIDEEGFVRFNPLGGFDPKTLTAQRVVVHGKKDIVGVMGVKPIHMMTAEERGKPMKISDYFIDLGLSKKEVQEFISVGDPVTRHGTLIEMGDCVNCKSIDNRVSVFILIETLRELKGKKIPYDLHAVFTVQEEVGIRGAIVAAHNVNPHFGFGLDTTIAFDIPGSNPHEMVTQIGKGAAIKIMDRSTICDYRMVKYMKDLANKKEIKWQAEVLNAGGTDTAGIQRYGKHGAISGAVSIPTRHIHQVIEMASKSDIRDCIDLLKVCISELDNWDWSFK